MSGAQFDPATRWIWMAGDGGGERNARVLFRHVIEVPAWLQRAVLRISADSRYIAWLDGVRLGDGPQRAYPWSYSYDEHDVTALLRPGQPALLAVLVQHWGEHTFQHLHTRPGLLCELVGDGGTGPRVIAASGAGWRARRDPSLGVEAPRIAQQQGFEEHHDARAELTGWTTFDHDDSGWAPCVEVATVDGGPWQGLHAREVRQLGAELLHPTALLAAEPCAPRPGVHWCFDLDAAARASAGGRDRGLPPPGRGAALLATEVVAERDCTATVRSYTGQPGAALWVHVDGTGFSGEERCTVRLSAGRNLVALRDVHDMSLHWESDAPLRFDASRICTDGGGTAAWAYLGPLDERRPIPAATLADLHATAAENGARWAGLRPEEALLDVFALRAGQRFFSAANAFCSAEVRRGPDSERPPLDTATGPLLDNPDALLAPGDAAAVVHPQPGAAVHLLVDFGREVAGEVCLDLDAEAGAVLDGVMVEGIDNSGIFWTKGLRNSFRYVARDGRQHFRSAQRRGFRYLSLTVDSAAPVRLHGVSCIERTYPVEARGSFACSDPLLDQIWSVSARTVQLCMEDTYVDCPAYEQTFWVGDARNSALVNAVAFGAFELTDRCLRLAADSMDPRVDPLRSGAQPPRQDLPLCHLPSGWIEVIPMWSFLWMWSAAEHHLLTGDRDALQAHHDAVSEALRRCEQWRDGRDLLDIPDVWNFVDWTTMDLPRQGVVTATNVLYVRALREAAQMADWLGDSALAADRRALADRVAAAVNRHCWSEQRNAYVDTVRDRAEEMRVSEPTNTLALLCGVVPPQRRAAVQAMVEHAVAGEFRAWMPGQPWDSLGPTDVVPVGSPWFLFFTCEALVESGRADLAVRIIREQWKRMLDHGATSFWETFPAAGEDGHWSRSLCHGWSAAPAYFLSRLVLGVRPLQPGHAVIEVAPFTAGLGWARGTVPTPLGDVHVSWTARPDGRVDLECTVPPGCRLVLGDNVATTSAEPVLTGGAHGDPPC